MLTLQISNNSSRSLWFVSPIAFWVSTLNLANVTSWFDLTNLVKQGNKKCFYIFQSIEYTVLQ